MDGIPHELFIHPKVGVYQTVSHGPHKIPGNMRVLFFNSSGI